MIIIFCIDYNIITASKKKKKKALEESTKKKYYEHNKRVLLYLRFPVYKKQKCYNVYCCVFNK